MRKLLEAIRKLERWIDKPWVLPALGFFAFIDLFIMIIPTEGILITTTMLRPKRWWAIALWLCTSSALGALCLAVVSSWFGPPIVQYLFGDISLNQGWLQAEQTIRSYGPWALIAIVISPLPQHPAIVISALAKMPLPLLFAMVWLGRALKYGVFGWMASHAPRMLMKIPGIRHEVERIRPELAHPGRR